MQERERRRANVSTISGEAAGEVIAGAAVEPHALAVLAGDDAKAVMLDLVQPRIVVGTTAHEEVVSLTGTAWHAATFVPSGNGRAQAAGRQGCMLLGMSSKMGGRNGGNAAIRPRACAFRPLAS